MVQVSAEGEARRRAELVGPIENTTAAVETRKRLLEVCERRNWPERERIMIRNGLLTLASHYDSSLMLGYVEPQLQRMRLDSGAAYWDRFPEVSEPSARAKRCFQHAQQVYDATPVAERVLSPTEAVGALALPVGVAQTLGRQSQGLALLSEALVLADFMSLLVPGLRAYHTTTLHAVELVRGRADIASQMRREIMAYYDGLLASGAPVNAVSRVGRAITLQVEGFERARAGREDANEPADKLEGPIFPDAEINGIGAHIWIRRAWEIRRMLHLYRGEAAGARSCQEQLDRLSTRHAYSPYGAGASFLEAQAFAMTSDLMGLKQSIEAITLIVEKQYPGWTPFLQVATSDYHRLRGEPERALEGYDSVLAAVSAGTHVAWAPAATAKVEALLALGRNREALECAEQSLGRCLEVELGFIAELELERVLALAQASLGQAEVAAGRIERLFERAAAFGVYGVRVGMLHEARARVALAADDVDGFASAAACAAEIYRAGRNPALVAKYERLIEAARSNEMPLSSDLTHAAEISAALGLSQSGQGFHTAFEECEDGASRKKRGLSLLIERSGAKGGFLYSVSATGAIALQAAQPEAEPPADLEVALKAYLQAELDDAGDVTVTCFDEGARTSSLGAAAAYQPVLLWSTANGDRVIAGVAALLCDQAHFTMPNWELLAAVSKVLPEQDDEIVSIIG